MGTSKWVLGEVFIDYKKIESSMQSHQLNVQNIHYKFLSTSIKGNWLFFAVFYGLVIQEIGAKRKSVHFLHSPNNITFFIAHKSSKDHLQSNALCVCYSTLLTAFILAVIQINISMSHGLKNDRKKPATLDFIYVYLVIAMVNR